MKFEENTQNELLTEKQKKWDETIKKLERTVDGLGLGIEENIIDTVAALNMNSVCTSSSCGGHIEKNDLSFPYVGGEAEERPSFRYIGEKEIQQELIRKYKLENWRDIFDNGQIEKEYYDLTENLEETLEYKDWYEKNNLARQNVMELLEEFMATRSESSIRMKFVYPGYRIEADGFKREEVRDREQIEKDILAAQEEFNLFTEFLKQRYFLT